MTKSTVSSLGPTTVNAALENIDRWLETGYGRRPFFQGPFGVLDLLQTTSSRNPEAVDDVPPSQADGQTQDCGNRGIVERYAAEMHPIADESVLPAASTHRQLFEPPPPSTVASPCDDRLQDALSPHSPMSRSSVGWDMREAALSPDVPPRALDLLRLFKANALSFSSPLRGSPDCPWQTIHLPAAMSTYAELLVTQTASHHRLSLFHSLVSASCLYGGAERLRDTMDCETSRVSSQELAKQHLKLALEEERTGRHPVKYKELLMAILSMIYLEILSEDYHDAQRLLVEAEWLIRRRGFSKAQRSCQARTLHHIYTWLRILAESTCGCALVRVCPARPNASLVADGRPAQALRSFRLPSTATLSELDMEVEKTDPVGYEDLHLEVMGTWSSSLFHGMYGIPESLMGLLSQAIRVANEQELLARDTLADVEFVTHLNQRARRLEHRILSWDQRPSPASSERDRAPPQPPGYNRFAMHQSLILFYYRRVHNLNALILQETVRKSLRFIEQACSSNTTEGHNSSLLWSGFIAACEAVDKSLQVRLLDWLHVMFRRTAVGTFATAADVVQKVWKAREETGDYTLSWFDVMGHDRCPIIVV
ncbi:fungal specific transcription factor domain-containing protein [Aspergillus brunneoviolaceus CBS 621.78]|uniref:Uncharacterized protein n=1 Tax=Aspergillus brunneoviolaceus CBS 621.78 TaxID=1450534 RepID=A0ACD1G8U3_9EURO|nr:hypothetical protein BO95DRAFT_413673 [Aspergillus brunneoviolaceus CBS 621.78]RAH45687.1 hypothetical protein BO95DRAFT_413673 [Aspergillus brunneoviolaceus CBS 621.78]